MGFDYLLRWEYLLSPFRFHSIDSLVILIVVILVVDLIVVVILVIVVVILAILIVVIGDYPLFQGVLVSSVVAIVI